MVPVVSCRRERGPLGKARSRARANSCTTGLIEAVDPVYRFPSPLACCSHVFAAL